MTEKECLLRMVPPRQRRPGIWRGGILQIWVTRACNLGCFGCTQGSNLGGNPGAITPDQFRDACLSLRGYFGVVGVFGGNPAMHREFPRLCEIMRETVPYARRGIWCNDPLGQVQGEAMAETFNPCVSNLNVHQVPGAIDRFRKWWPASLPYLLGIKTDSRHTLVYVAMRDIGIPESERWERISRCDINQRWSAMIGVFRGQLRSWVCEIMGAQAMLHQDDTAYPDTGLPVVPGWWRQPMDAFADQVSSHCHDCGVPLRDPGALANAPIEIGVEKVSAAHEKIFRPKRPVKVQRVTEASEVNLDGLQLATDYIGNAR